MSRYQASFELGSRAGHAKPRCPLLGDHRLYPHAGTRKTVLQVLSQRVAGAGRCRHPADRRKSANRVRPASSSRSAGPHEAIAKEVTILATGRRQSLPDRSLSDYAGRLRNGIYRWVTCSCMKELDAFCSLIARLRCNGQSVFSMPPLAAAFATHASSSPCTVLTAPRSNFATS